MLAGVLLAGLTLVTPTNVSAVERAPENFRPIGAASTDINQLSPAERQDLEKIATQTGISMAKAIESFGWHSRFSGLVSALRDRWPDEFAGARIEESGNSHAWVAFRGQAPSEAVGLIREFPQRVAIREGRGYSEAQLARRLVEAHYAILAQTHLVATASSGYDVATGEITVVVERRVPAGDIMAELQRTVDGRPGEWPVRITPADKVTVGLDIIYGGGNLSSCTAGFVVVGAVTRGISTAGHCSNSLSYEGRSLRFINEHQGNFGDVQWHTRDGETHFNQFYWNGSQLRWVWSTGTATEGQWVCRHGITTNYVCDRVYQLNHCNGSRCGLVAMQGRYAAAGDSGGPWFNDNTAYGIHHGYKYWFGYRDLYTPVVYLPSALGVSVALS